ncbi:hypothetical protein BN871_CG_00090 [Paenibacillus sp. P22]|nr:hypothetical protein BN871_CG_00090 [Paenibacillus sp. P22]
MSAASRFSSTRSLSLPFSSPECSSTPSTVLPELNPDQQRLEAADQEEESAGNQIQNADFFVVDSRQPVHETGMALDRMCVSQGWYPLQYR